MYDIDVSHDRQARPPGDRSSVWIYTVMIVLATAIVVLGAVAILLTIRDDETATTTSSTSATTEPITTSPATSATTVSTTTESTTTATSDTTSTTDTTSTSSTATTSTTSTTPTTNPELATAVWPWADSGVRYADPVQAALGFATDYVGYENPIAGEFRQGDSRSGEVEIRAVEDGPASTVFVRQLVGDDWWVLGSATDSIVIGEPRALAIIESPVLISGGGRGPEGVVEIQLRSDGRSQPLAQATVAVGTGDALEPFETSIAWSGRTADRGALVLVTRTADGNVLQMAVRRVTFDLTG